ncbi:hypothetical protein AB6A40_000660 [Gnathostoma spinigerum]|uniref:1-Cys peroxiredoxin n=1 Tax=Gnathostoma spinigerum TaxID=75299 RepID=A0ABD6E4L0_9BILA
MAILLGETFPDFSAITSDGEIKSFHAWMGKSWAILFSHPRDFTPVCTTELGQAALLSRDFQSRNVKLMALSCDSAESHRKWISDIVAYCKMTSGGCEGCADLSADSFPFPIIADEKRKLAQLLGMIDPDEKDEEGNVLTARTAFIIGPDKKLKLSMLYPATTGRNFSEILRVIDSLQLTSVNPVATPVNWKPGDECMVIPTLSEAEAGKKFGGNVRTAELPSKKRYMRYVSLPH